MKGNLKMTINFEEKTYEESVCEITNKLIFAMTASIDTSKKNMFDDVLKDPEIKNKNFLKATIIDRQNQTSEFLKFFMLNVPSLIFIAEIFATNKNKVFYVCY